MTEEAVEDLRTYVNTKILRMYRVTVKTGDYSMHITNEFFCFKGLVAYNTKEMNKTASTLHWIEKINIAVRLLK